MFTIRIVSTPENIDRLRERGDSIVDAITERMTLEMFKLQSEIVGTELPNFFPNGAPNIASTVRANPAELQGTVIVGSVEAGGPRTTKTTLKSGALVDYAAVQHEGINHSYEILPFNKKALAFELGGAQLNLFLEGGNKVVVRRVMHPGLRPRPFMTSGLEAMREEIISGLQEAFAEAMA